MDIANQILPILLGGILSGGVVIAWIEYQRHRHEKIDWELKEKKIELRVIESDSIEKRWKAESCRDEAEKLRIYESDINGKIKEWEFLIKIVISNLTNSDVLALSMVLEIPQLNIEKKTLKDKAIKEKCHEYKLLKYDLMKKNIINDWDLPIVIPANTSTGIVLFGRWTFDYPFLVMSKPTTSTFKVVLDDKTTRSIRIDFNEKDDYYLNDIRSGPDGYEAWSPYLEKIGFLTQEDELPF